MIGELITPLSQPQQSKTQKRKMAHPNTKSLQQLLIFLFCFSCTIHILFAATANEWKKRTIYQVLTDRFALPNSTRAGSYRHGNQGPSCNNLGNYCGGTWRGIQDNLDYIQGMGFDAIWISPIVSNMEGGYHGYWLNNLWQLNSHFGTEQDLKNLIDSCHKRDMLVMVDVVFNHVAPIGMNFQKISPFNQSSHYHPYCEVNDYTNQTQVELCRLAELPDLDQTNPFVYSQLSQWIQTIINKFEFDGVRLDTVPYISQTFWKSIMSDTIVPKCANTYLVGEVFDGRIDYAAGYANIIGGTLNYPLYFTLKSVYGGGGNMFDIRTLLQLSASSYNDPSILGIFIDNHDNSRFLHDYPDVKRYQNALTYILFAQGIPIVYYGSEQGFSGGNDPNNREILWNSMNTKSYWYTLMKNMVQFRSKVMNEIWNAPHVERYVEENFYCFSRGLVFVATTNAGLKGPSRIQYQVQDHDYSEGQYVCNVFYPTVDCVQIKGGILPVVLLNGESKIFYPRDQLYKLLGF